MQWTVVDIAMGVGLTGRGLAPISANFIDTYLPVDDALYYIGTEEGRANPGWTLK